MIGLVWELFLKQFFEDIFQNISLMFFTKEVRLGTWKDLFSMSNLYNNFFKYLPMK